MEHQANGACSRASAAVVRWHTLGEGFTWETQDKARDLAAAAKAWETAKALMQEPDLKLIVLDEINIALRYDYLPARRGCRDAEEPQARPACRGHRAERQARDDRGGRSRHQNHSGEASLRRRGEGASRHRVLMAARVLMLQGTGSSVGKSLLVAGLARALVKRGLERQAVQAAEHVEQRRRDGGRRRDRPRPGAAGSGGLCRTIGAYEPGAAETPERGGRAGDRPGQGARAGNGAGDAGSEAEPDAVRASKFRQTEARGRHRPGRRRGQRVGDKMSAGK